MRKSTFLGALALALSASTGAFAAPLALTVTNPEEGDVNAKTEWWEYFETINLEFDQPVYLTEGKTVSLMYPGADKPAEIEPNMMFATMDFDGAYTVIINGSEDMKYNGEYVLTVQAGTFTNEAGEPYGGKIFTWNVTGLTDLPQETPGSSFKLTGVSPEEGDVNAKNEGWEYFETINLTFNEPTYLAEGKTVSLKYPGSDVPEELNPLMMFATMDMGGGAYTVIINGTEEMKLNGEYTLTVAPGTFTNEAGDAYEGGSFTWNVTGLADEEEDMGDTTPLTITSLYIGEGEESDEKDAAGHAIMHIKPHNAFPLEDGSMLEAIYENDVIEVLLNHSDKAKAVKWAIVDNTAEETILSGWMKKLSSGVFTMTPGWIDIELYEGHEYSLTFHAYNQEPSQGRVEYGQGAEVKILGLTEGFTFSDVRCLGFYPVPENFPIESVDQNRITVIFSEPAVIDEDASYIETGDVQHVRFESVEYDNSNRNVVTLVIPKAIIEKEDQRLKLVVYAFDYSDKQIEGNNGVDEESHLEVDYTCNVATNAPLLSGLPRYSDTSSIKVSSPVSREYISEGYTAYPYLTDLAGKTVAVMDKDKGYVTTEWGKDWAGNDVPKEQEFTLIDSKTDEVFSTPGNYYLVFPRGTFVFGTDQYFHYLSKKGSYPVEIAEMVSVDYTAAGHHVSLGEVAKGESLSFAVTPANGWKVSSIKLNGEEILDHYSKGVLTIPSIDEDADIVADMMYDGDVFISTGVDDVVSPLNISVWSEGGKLYARGLKAGQTVALYTINGALVCEESVTEDGDGEFTVASGIYLLVITDKGESTAIKAVNK